MKEGGVKRTVSRFLIKLLKDVTQPFAQFSINGSGDGFFVGWNFGSMSGSSA